MYSNPDGRRTRSPFRPTSAGRERISARRRPFDEDRGTEVEGGVNVLAGLDHRNGFFAS